MARIHLGFSVAPLVDEADSSRGYVLTFQDLTEVMELERESAAKSGSRRWERWRPGWRTRSQSAGLNARLGAGARQRAELFSGPVPVDANSSARV